MKDQILHDLNAIIQTEKGEPVAMDGMFTDSGLDSLGTMLTLVTLDNIYPILTDVKDGDINTALDIPNLTVRELISKCKLSIIDTFPELNDDQAT